MIRKLDIKPSKIVALGLNYRDHAVEFNKPVPENPMLFIKPSTSVIYDGEDIVYPAGATRVDYEAELAVVIGRKAVRVAAADAQDYIEGYTCLNDVTERDMQALDGQWTRAKGFDTFCPIGPVITNEVDPSNINVKSYLNGELRQSSNTKNLIFDVAAIVEFVSGIMTLLPGDVIATGTPSGIGPMLPGDEIVIELEGIGRLCNRVVEG
ncbi:MAG TPA: fumarylacetoacetate hydrolase family protein [bacterium]|nr:fumarylacetoacetate hydrolase family protein [bacterium]